MAEPLHLVPSPNISAVKQKEVITFLKDRLAEAEAGHISEAVLIVLAQDGTWRFDHTYMESSTAWIGKLETVKVLLMKDENGNI